MVSKPLDAERHGFFIMEEIWKPINGYENLYEVSNIGRIRSLEKKVLRKNGLFNNLKAKMMKNRDSGIGYYKISLHSNGGRKSCFVHRLVAMSFLHNSDNKPCVNHINGIRTDNRVENLEWCTYSENNSHAFRVLNKIHHFKGKTYGQSIRARGINQLSVDDVFIKKWSCAKEIHDVMGFRQISLSNACRSNEVFKGFKWKFANEQQ